MLSQPHRSTFCILSLSLCSYVIIWRKLLASWLKICLALILQLDIVAEFELDKKALESAAESNEEFSCQTSGGAAKRGALGPFGLLLLADSSLSEHTPVFFYVAKGSGGTVNTYFCADQTRYVHIKFFIIGMQYRACNVIRL